MKVCEENICIDWKKIIGDGRFTFNCGIIAFNYDSKIVGAKSALISPLSERFRSLENYLLLVRFRSILESIPEIYGRTRHVITKVDNICKYLFSFMSQDCGGVIINILNTGMWLEMYRKDLVQIITSTFHTIIFDHNNVTRIVEKVSNTELNFVAPPRDLPHIDCHPPLIQQGDVLKCNCTSYASKPAASLMFYLNEGKVSENTN